MSVDVLYLGEIIAQIVDAIGIFDGEHGHAMFDLLEPLDGPLAHALGWTIGRDQIRVLGLKLFQPLHQAIVL